MSPRKTVVTVTIGSDEYTLRSDRPAEYTREVARHVDEALKEVLAAGTMVESHKAAILAALAVTDELFQAQRAQKAMASELHALAGELSRLLPPDKRPSSATKPIASSGEGN